jgi:septum site-determining protein MinC
MLRGTPDGLELVFDGRPFGETTEELWNRIGERPDFYRGSSALVVFGEALPAAPEFGAFLTRVRDFGIDVRGVRGPSAALSLADAHALAFTEGAAVKSTARKAKADVVRLPEKARSLDADFAGARADLARRRRARGPVTMTPVSSVASVALQKEASTLFVRATLRGGKSVQQLGNVVVVGDVNPGAEIVASGDIVVFGTLRGTVHAGAQGDESARVYAIELMPTQLRIAKYIAAEAENVRSRPVAEEAYIEQGRIVIAPRGAVR